MRTFERQKAILKIVQEKNDVSVNYLVNHLNASEATIRRDLTKMDFDGLLKRVHGRAIALKSNCEEMSYQARKNVNIGAKRRIAEKCIDLIPDNSSLFLDSSSTAASLIPLLNNKKGLTIITNCLSTAQMIAQETNFRVFVPGGFVNSSSNAIIGQTSIDLLSRIYCSFFILSTLGVSLTHGLTEASLENSDVKKYMLENSSKRILLVDSSKFEKVYLAKTCDLSKMDYLISEENLNKDYLNYCKENDIEVIIANK